MFPHKFDDPRECVPQLRGNIEQWQACDCGCKRRDDSPHQEHQQGCWRQRQPQGTAPRRVQFLDEPMLVVVREIIQTRAERRFFITGIFARLQCQNGCRGQNTLSLRTCTLTSLALLAKRGRSGDRSDVENRSMNSLLRPAG